MPAITYNHWSDPVLYPLASLTKKLFGRTLSRVPSRRPSSVRPGLEMLEDRRVPSASPWPTHFFAPYVNTLQGQTDARFNDYATAAANASTKYLALGFITANGAGQPSWEGDGNELGSDFDVQMQNQVARLRAQGGDVLISFGGAAGTELAMAIQDPQQLQQAYQQVIDEYGLTHVDFDIEGAAATDTSGSIDRRSQAIAGLEQWATAQGKDLKVYLTLPTSSSGLMADQGLNVLDSALRNGVNIAGVNIMTMDYCDFVNYDGHTGPSMGQAAINAAQGLFTQLKSEPALQGLSDSQIWQMIDITPQIGTNVQYVDGEFHGTEVFSLNDAQTVESFAASKGVGRLSFWAIGVDQNPDGITNAPDPSETYSGVLQQPFEFSHIFAQYATPPVNGGPILVQPAQAANPTLDGTSTTLTVQATDAMGGPNVSFHWASINGPAAVSFDANDSATANTTHVTFAQAGSYTLEVTVSDAAGDTITSDVTVNVDQKLTSVVVSPGSASVSPGGSQQFTAQALDQFGTAMNQQPAFTWSVDNGTVDANGLYQAPAAAGAATVTATSGGVSGTATVTIAANLSATASFADTQDWGTGFTGYITITNTGTSDLNGWTLAFDFSGNLTDIWDAKIVHHDGNHYVIQNESWDAPIAAGQSVSFGFNADWGADFAAPTNYTLNGVPIGQI
jgi:chitinase